MCIQHDSTHTTRSLCPRCLNALSCHLSSVQSSQRKGGLVCGLLNLDLRSGKDDFDMHGVTLVRVNTTVGTVCATTGFLNGTGGSMMEIGGRDWS